MTSSLQINFGQGLVSRRASSLQARPIAARQRLVVRATAGDQITLLIVYVFQIVGGEGGGQKCSLCDKQWTYHVLKCFIFTETEVAEELKTLEIMRKFSEQYAKRYVGN